MKNTILITLTVVAFYMLLISACAIAVKASVWYLAAFAGSMLWMYLFCLANGYYNGRDEVEEDV